MDPFELKVNQIIDRKLESMSNLANANHAHNGYDVNQIDPSVGLTGFPVVQVSSATASPSDVPPNGTIRFQVDGTNYVLWAYLNYAKPTGSATGTLVGAWKSVTLT